MSSLQTGNSAAKNATFEKLKGNSEANVVEVLGASNKA